MLENNYQVLDKFLSRDISMTSWYISQFFEAHEILDKFKQEDWIKLQSSWFTKSKEWRYRCAEILNWADEEYAIPLLIEMIKDTDNEVAMIAAYSLSAYQITRENYLEIINKLNVLSLDSKLTEIVTDLIRSRITDAKDSI